MTRFFGTFVGALSAVLVTAPAQAASGPGAVVSAFYAQLLQGTNDRAALFARFLAPSTDVLYERAELRNRHELVLDFDPPSGTQVGINGVRIGSPTITGTRAEVPVTLAVGLRHDQHLARRLTVVLHRIGGSWRIWDWIYHDPGHPDWTFRTTLAIDLARPAHRKY
jgi:hypothetical protein